MDNVLDPARERLGKPIRVNSGYRCPKHNSAVGGVRNSQHMSGEAADIVPVKSEELKVKSEAVDIVPVKSEELKVKSELARLVEIIKENGKFDQLIIYSTFVHVSWKRLGPNRLQIMRKGGA